MNRPYEVRLICVVAQEKFDVDCNTFCKLAPIVYADGVVPVPDDFPNDGEVWWMLAPQSESLAEPGRLLSCWVEDARDFRSDDLTKSRYQAKRESVRDLDPREGLELLTAPDNALGTIQDLVSSSCTMVIDHRPSPSVLLRWRDDIYGPFSTTLDLAAAPGQTKVHFTPTSPDLQVYRIANDAFTEAAGAGLLSVQTDVSLTQHRRLDCANLCTIRHELILGAGFERVLGTDPDRLVLEPTERKIARLSKPYLTRRKRQELRALLDEVDLTAREAGDDQELSETIEQIKSATVSQDEALGTLTSALLNSGVLGEERLRKAEQEYAEKYVEQSTAELQARIEDQIRANREDLRKVNAELENAQAKALREEREAREQLKRRIEEQEETAKGEIETRKRKLETREDELKHQETVLKGNLEKVTRELREAGDDVVNRFLALAPLLGATTTMGCGSAPIESTETDAGARSPEDAFELPTYVVSARPKVPAALAEEEFLERFLKVVQDAGFVYRAFDLQRFHVSVKCGELTILSGPSGIGKSSLPLLYGKALLGDDQATGRRGCQMVNVSPAWMDVRDLLGHMNTLDGQYYPAESGLYQHMIYAQEEFATNGDGTGIYLSCLDEMNLSQIEHYFSDVMMVLERDGADRAIQCFSHETASERCRFRRWARLELPPSIRFVGTVNLDETTRLLSDRLLDRVNMIQLGSASLPVAGDQGDASRSSAPGRMVTLADLRAWRREAGLPKDLGSLLDQLRPHLATMRCPLSPRVYKAICRFVGSSDGVMSPPRAFDAQLSQRIFSKIRTLVTQGQLDALDALIEILEDSPAGNFEESATQLREKREMVQSLGWNLGD